MPIRVKVRTRILVLLLLFVAALAVSLNPQWVYPGKANEGFSADKFLQSRYWENEAYRPIFQKRCQQKVGQACGKLAYLEEKSGRIDEAKRLYEKSCALEFKYSCDRLKDMTWYSEVKFPRPDAEFSTLKNGLTIGQHRDPNSTRFLFAVSVASGYADDPQGNTGLAHLVEHMRFKDNRLDRHFSYLEEINEHSGSGNGYTRPSSTLYFASVPAGSADWVTSMFARMFERRKFTLDQLERSRSEIALERLMRYPEAWNFLAKLVWVLPFPPSTEEVHFGTKSHFKSPIQEALNTNRMTLEDVTAFEQAHYVGRNMAIFLVGNYSAERVLPVVKAAFERFAPGKLNPRYVEELPKNPGPLFSPLPVGSPASANITLGTKYYGASAEDVIALDVYVEYVAQRIMEEVRNVRGQTYSATGLTRYAKVGKTVVSFQTPPELLTHYVHTLRQVMRKETSPLGLTDDQIQEAIWMYRNKRRSRANDTSSRLNDLEEDLELQRRSGSKLTTSQLTSRMNVGHIRDAFRKHFSPRQEWVTFTNPLNGYLYLGVLLLSIVGPFLWISRRKRKDRDESEYLYYERVTGSKLRWLFVIYLVVEMSLVLLSAGAWAVNALIPEREIGWWSLAIAHALPGPLFCAIWASAVAWLRSVGMREVGVADGSLILRGRHRDLWSIPLDEIESVKEGRAYQGLSPSAFLFHLRQMLFWQEGIVVSFKNKQRRFIPSRRTGKLLFRMTDAASPRAPFKSQAA